MSSFTEILDEIDSMDLESQAILIDIINNRYKQQRREFFVDETVESIREIDHGNFSTGSSKDLFHELDI